jgi:hypothetical protein
LSLPGRKGSTCLSVDFVRLACGNAHRVGIRSAVTPTWRPRGTRFAISLIEALAAHAADSAVRIRLGQALVEIGGTSALGVLRHLANDGDPAVAFIASAFVGTMDPSVRTCAETRRSAPNPLVKVGDGHGARWTRPSPWPALTEVHVRRWTNAGDLIIRR